MRSLRRKLALLPPMLAALVLGACSGANSGNGSSVEISGTVVRFAEPDYANAAWERVWDAEALLSRSGADSNLRLRGFQLIAGLDDENLWVIDRTGPLFGMVDGHWSYYGAVTDGAEAKALRAVSPGTVAVGRDFRRGGPPLVMVTPEGIRRFDSEQRATAMNSAHIAVLAEDFIDFYSAADLRGTSHRLLSGEFSPLRTEREREALVHREDNTPIADYPVHAIMSTATFQPRLEAYAFWRNPRRGGQGATAEFRDGIWVLRDQIPMDLSRVRASWFGRGDTGVFLIAVGEGGFVLRQILGGAALEQSLTGSLTAGTSAVLIAVWGQGPDHYYVMDTNGQVWLRSDNQWRSVVRGLYDEDVVFNAAYVAPNGSIHALTNTALYRLSSL